MASRQAPDGNTNIRAFRDSGSVHVTNMDVVHQPRARMSRLANQRSLGDSMLTYTQRMREIAQFRQDSALMTSADFAGSALSFGSQIHRGPELQRKGPHPSLTYPRPQSLDELIARKTQEKTLEEILRKKNRRYSVPNRLPSSTLPAESSHEKVPNAHVQINFVSASDLFDLVSFSLRSKTSRDENMKRLRYEESLLRTPDWLETVSSRQTGKDFEEKREDEDGKGVLAVYGVPSPRDTHRDSHRSKRHGKHDDRLKGTTHTSQAQQREHVSKGIFPNGPETAGSHHTELLREKHLLLLQPQRLRHRPKRARRMRLHRSQLTAIPEDERRRQEGCGVHVQETPSTRMPVIPSSSSLTAIKNIKKRGAGDYPHPPETKPQNKGLDRKGDNSFGHKPSATNSLSHETNTDTTRTRKSRRLHTDPNSESKAMTDHTMTSKTQHHVTEPSESHTSLPHNDPFPRRRSKSDRLSSRQNNPAGDAEGSRTHARTMNGQLLASLKQGSRARFSRLIFLRDTPDNAHQRHS